MKKKIFIFLLISIIVCTLAFCLISCARNKTKTDENGIMYELKENSYYSVIGLKKDQYASETVIPCEFEGLPVKTIASYAFDNRLSLTSITIPENVTTVESNPFGTCDSLTVYCEVARKPDDWHEQWNYNRYPVVWDCKNNEVADDGFIYTCVDGIRFALKDGEATVVQQPKNLTDVIIPTTITHGGISYAVTAIGNKAFFDNYNRIFVSRVSYGNLKSIVIPDSVTSVGESAFDNCEKLTSITVSKNIKSIAEDAFDNCEYISELKYAGSLESWCANDTMKNLTKVCVRGYKLYIDGVLIEGELTIPDKVTKICDYAFANCIKITNVILPDSVKNIGDYAFYCCNFASIKIPNGVTHIGESAFGSCGLINLSIPDSVTDIGKSAFSSNKFLTVTLPGSVTSVGGWAFAYCDRLNSVVLTGGVTKIGEFAFSDCTVLKSITIPSSVTVIGDWALYNCNNLKEIIYDGTEKQWKMIKLGYLWDKNTGDYTVRCSDTLSPSL